MVVDQRGIDGAVLLDELINHFADLREPVHDPLLHLLRAHTGTVPDDITPAAGAVGGHRYVVPVLRVEGRSVRHGLDLHATARRTGHIHGIDQSGR